MDAGDFGSERSPDPASRPSEPVAPGGVPLSSVGKRLGAYVLDAVLTLVTLGVGWLIWSLVVWGRGQTPAKQLLGMRTVDAEQGRALGWWRMALREVLVKGLLVGVLSAVTFGIVGVVAPLLIFGGTMRQTLWDRMVHTLVVDDPVGVTR